MVVSLETEAGREFDRLVADPGQAPAPKPRRPGHRSPIRRRCNKSWRNCSRWAALDPAARDSLMADLKQTDPALWPLMMQQFRAYAAYRRQAEQRDKAAAEQNRPTAVAAAPQAVAAAAVPPASVVSPVAVQRPLVSPPATAVKLPHPVRRLPHPVRQSPRCRRCRRRCRRRRPLFHRRRTAPRANRLSAGRRPARTAR